MSESQVPKLVPCRDMARVLSCSNDTVLRMVKTGRIPAVKIGREYRFDPRAVIGSLTRK